MERGPKKINVKEKLSSACVDFFIMIQAIGNSFHTYRLFTILPQGICFMGE